MEKRDGELRKTPKVQNATFWRVKRIVPRFFRIGFRFEKIPGRLAEFLQKWHFAFFRFDRFDIHFDSIDTASECRCGPVGAVTESELPVPDRGPDFVCDRRVLVAIVTDN